MPKETPTGAPQGEEKDKKPEDGILIADIYLHTSVMIDGQNETHLNSSKVRTIRAMYWVNNYSAVLIHARKNHVLPAAAIKDSILA